MSFSQEAVLCALNQYIFDNVDNKPSDECGVNLQLYPLNTLKRNDLGSDAPGFADDLLKSQSFFPSL